MGKREIEFRCGWCGTHHVLVVTWDRQPFTGGIAIRRRHYLKGDPVSPRMICYSCYAIISIKEANNGEKDFITALRHGDIRECEIIIKQATLFDLPKVKI